jgi:uncharacterized RDD family membrane protein YckC
MNADPGPSDNGSLPSLPAPLPLHRPPEPTISGFWRRFGASCLDSFVLGVVGVVLGYAFFDSFAHWGAWARLVGYVIAVAYLTWGNGVLGKGQTVGKRMLHIEVVDVNRRHISVGRAAVRALVLATPFFLNGVTTTSFSVITIVVFLLCPVLGGSIVYLAAFNRRTRQSVHDLVTGSYVVHAGMSAAPRPERIWRGHFVVLSAIAVLFIGAAVALQVVVPKTFLSRLLATREALLATGKFHDAGVYVGTNYSSFNGVKRQASFMQVTVISKTRPTDYVATADEVAKLVLASDPEAGQKDALVVMIRYGYDIGIARGWLAWHSTLSPTQWRAGAARAQPHAPVPGR